MAKFVSDVVEMNVNREDDMKILIDTYVNDGWAYTDSYTKNNKVYIVFIKQLSFNKISRPSIELAFLAN